MEATAKIQGAISQSLWNMRATAGVHAQVRYVQDLFP
jgi:hypothetical protein